MVTKIKSLVSSVVLDCLKKNGSLNSSSLNKIYENLTFQSRDSNVIISLSLSELNVNGNLFDTPAFGKDLDDKIIEKTAIIAKNKGLNLEFIVNKPYFVSSCLSQIGSFNFSSIPKERVVVDFSSPNIAKPFHFGHLRSTIIGNFIANILKFTQNDPVKINYLGDWGTQFGILMMGLKILNITEAEIRSNPIEILYKAYVKGNAAAEENPSIFKEAQKEFNQLEKSGIKENNEVRNSWQLYKSFTVENFKKMYERLNVTFDVYSWESDYSNQNMQSIIGKLDLFSVTNEKGQKVIDLGNDRIVPILKSDGSTLYITRDIAAAIDRYEKFKFSKMLYVVDMSQSLHFESCFKILERMNYSWSQDLMHVKFGRVKGMSSRKGQVVFLSDILDEAKNQMLEKQIQSITTKDSTHSVSDTLGISAVIINDLKQRRMKNYEFTWDRALQTDGDTGVKLQYTHCRLVSLEAKANITLPIECDPSALTEPEAIALMVQIARFEEVILKSYCSLEACILVNYLFKLCNAINKAFKVLKVKDEPPLVAANRLLLFSSARQVLNQGMKILGLKPLDFM